MWQYHCANCDNGWCVCKDITNAHVAYIIYARFYQSSLTHLANKRSIRALYLGDYYTPSSFTLPIHFAFGLSGSVLLNLILFIVGIEYSTIVFPQECTLYYLNVSSHNNTLAMPWDGRKSCGWSMTPPPPPPHTHELEVGGHNIKCPPPHDFGDFF